MSHFGFLESVLAHTAKNNSKFGMPAHSGRYVNTPFKDLLDKFGMQGVDSSKKAFSDSYEVKDGWLSDLGELYHRAFNSQMTLFLQNGSTLGNHIVTYCLSGKNVLIQSNSHISVHIGLQMAGVKTYYVQPEYDAEFDMLLPIRPA